MFSIGKITKSQGLKGEMKVLPFGDSVLFEATEVFVDQKPYKLLSAQERPNGIFVVLDGIDSVEKANELKNKEIQIPIELAHKLVGADKYLWSEVIGSDILLKNDSQLTKAGQVNDIDNFGSADIFFAQTSNGKTFSFPIVKGLILSIENGKIVLDSKRFGEVVCYDD